MAEAQSIRLEKRYLPTGLLRIANYCGDDVMWSMIQHFGGQRIEVPKRIAPGHILYDALGADGAVLLCAAFGGEQLVVARGDSAIRAVRNASIRADAAAGLSTGNLAKKYRLTYRQIQNICRGTGPELPCFPMTIDLFDDAW